MADSAYGFSQAVKVMKAIIVAGKGRHILWPRRKDKQRPMGADYTTNNITTSD
jgi:hypothetical protein